jgi:hypothetical protein
MPGFVSWIKTHVGAITAAFAERMLSRDETIETVAGFLLLGGFTLIGSALPVVL